VAVLDLLAFKGSQAAQLHVQDGPGLQLVDVQQFHQAVARSLGGIGGPDQGDDLVQHVQGLQECTQDVRFLLGLAQAVPGAAGDDIQLVRDPVTDKGIEAKRAGHAVHDRQHVGAEVFL
jgi:hypothetical protein